MVRRMILGFSTPIIFPIAIFVFILVFLVGAVVTLLPHRHKRIQPVTEHGKITPLDTQQGMILTSDNVGFLHFIKSKVHPKKILPPHVIAGSKPIVIAPITNSNKVVPLVHIVPAVVAPKVVTIPKAIVVTPPTTTIVPVAVPKVSVPVVAPPAINTTKFEITCYDPLSAGSTTATGTQVGYGQVAVDPSVIKLGSTIDIAGLGSFTATDTGGAIIGNHIDVWMPTLMCDAWGTQFRTVWF